jgi:DNA-binding transcriptional LysR family regulator
VDRSCLGAEPHRLDVETDAASGTSSDDLTARPETAAPTALALPVASDSFLKPSFTLEQIRTFLAVAAREHVTLAARALRLSQAAVTQQVQLFERALGVRLLQRVGRNVRLTDAGVELAGGCLLIMRSLENLERTARSLRSLELGTLNIGASEVGANYYLPGTLAAFSTAHPGINLDVTVATTADVCSRVASADVECGLVDAPLPKTDLVHTAVATDEVLLVAHPQHELTGIKRVRAKDLEGHRYLVWSSGAATEIIASEMLGYASTRLPRIHLTSIEAVRRSLLSGLGFAALPRAAVADDLRSGALAAIDVPPRSRAICALRRPGTSGPMVDVFWALLVGERSPSSGLGEARSS